MIEAGITPKNNLIIIIKCKLCQRKLILGVIFILKNHKENIE